MYCFRAWSMRRCQPSPSALKCSITSGDKRIDVFTFVGERCLPRWPMVRCRFAGRTSDIGRIRFTSASVSSRTSPSLSVSRIFIAAYLPWAGLPQADVSNPVLDWRKAHHMHALANLPQSDKPALWLLETVVFREDCTLPVKVLYRSEG